jgi:large subunit ribosomal protein L19
MELLKKVAASHLRTQPIGDFQVGDTVNVHTRIKEGDKERVQVFNGTVISCAGGHGEVNDAFTVRRVVAGEGVERIFPVHSPRVVKVEVVRKGRVRRAKLFYLRDRVGKSTKVKEQLAGLEAAEAAPAAQP